MQCKKNLHRIRQQRNSQSSVANDPGDCCCTMLLLGITKVWRSVIKVLLSDIYFWPSLLCNLCWITFLNLAQLHHQANACNLLCRTQQMEPTAIWQYRYFQLMAETHPAKKRLCLTEVKPSKCPKYSPFSNFYSLSKMGQYLGSFTNICKRDNWQDTSCFPFQKLITTVQMPLCFVRNLDKKKKSCFVSNNTHKVVGMDLIAAHAMEHSRLNLHNGNTQTTGLSSVDTTLKLK